MSRTKKQRREGTHAVPREEQRRRMDPNHNSGLLGPDEVWVCRHCHKLAHSKPELGSCVGLQVKCKESSIVWDAAHRNILSCEVIRSL